MIDILKKLQMRFLQWILPKKKNRVYYISFKGKSYSDNPRAVSEKVYQLYGDKLEYIWAIDDKTDISSLPNYIRIIKANSFKSIYYLSTSKIWVSNFCFPSWTVKSKKQYYIQTWHGDIAIKKILLDNKKRDYFFESHNIDLLLAGSEFGKKIMASAFGYSGQMLTVGSPRNDIFFGNTNKETIVRIRQLYGISASTKILLYAPTFRKKYKTTQQHIGLDLEKVRETLEEVTKEKWVVLLRSHEENSNLGFDTNNPSFLNVTKYPEMNELLLITDILISDYSSCVADFALTGKLAILYQSDLSDYTSADRNIYSEFFDSPFYKFTEPKSLYDFLKVVTGEDAQKNCQDILKYYGSLESGHSSEEVAKFIKKAVDGNN